MNYFLVASVSPILSPTMTFNPPDLDFGPVPSLAAHSQKLHQPGPFCASALSKTVTTLGPKPDWGHVTPSKNASMGPAPRIQNRSVMVPPIWTLFARQEEFSLILSVVTNSCFV